MERRGRISDPGRSKKDTEAAVIAGTIAIPEET